MKDRSNSQINISAPNLVNICVDESADGELSGRLYHCYTTEPWQFSNVVQLLMLMEELYDGISFPQASTSSRHFVRHTPSGRKFQKVREQKDLLPYRGEKGTFITFVRYRQNSAWQGEVVWMEGDRKETFVSTLEFMKLISNKVIF